jgi:hypothetical protein
MAGLLFIVNLAIDYLSLERPHRSAITTAITINELMTIFNAIGQKIYMAVSRHKI